jgi:hypothetical protein
MFQNEHPNTEYSRYSRMVYGAKAGNAMRAQYEIDCPTMREHIITNEAITAKEDPNAIDLSSGMRKN